MNESSYSRKEILSSNNISEIINSFLDDLIQSFINEKEFFSRSNQPEKFKNKIKPAIGKSFTENEFENLINLKNDEFKKIIKLKFDQQRDKRKKIITETANLQLEKKIFVQTTS